MIHVYLDQNKWVDLARANVGRQDGMPFRAVLDTAVAAAGNGTACFPLSAYHYLETWNSDSHRRRGDLANVMLRLARPAPNLRPITIASPIAIMRMEIAQVLSRVFGRPSSPGDVRPFGRGMGFALGGPPVGFPKDDPVRYQFARAIGLDQIAIREMEASAISDPPAYGSCDNGESYRQFTHKFAECASAIARAFADIKATKAFREHDLAKLILWDLQQPLAEVAVLSQIDPQKLVDWLQDDPIGIVRQLPSQHVQFELTLLRFDNPQTKHKKGDLEDLAALGIAVPYCDVVVTEKSWTGLVRRTGLREQYSTEIFHDLRDLLPLLSSAPSAGSLPDAAGPAA